MKNLYEALAKAQVNFKVPVKDKKAHYGDYASIGSINAATHKALSQEGLSVWQPIVTENNIVYIKTILTHSSGEALESMMALPMIEKGGNYFHKLGSAISYTRRYTLMAILNISADDVEDDGDALEDTKVVDPIVNEHQFNTMKDIFETLSHDNKLRAKDCLKQQYKVDSSQKLLAKHYDEFVRFLNALLQHQQDQFAAEVQNV